MADSFQHLVLQIDENGLATVTINRPKKLNALNREVLKELEKVFSQLHDDKQTKGILITGAGDKAFVAGADIEEIADLKPEDGEKFSAYGQRVFHLIEEMPRPVAAVVNGYALGGGLELALACHLRIAEKNAVFGLPEVGLGLIPGYGGTQRLTHLLGKGRALEIILTGDFVKADKAEHIGLVNTIAEKGKGMKKARKMMQTILQNGPLAVEYALKSVQASAGDLSEGFRYEAEAFGKLCGTRDFKEGTSAFLEKRDPQFTGN